MFLDLIGVFKYRAVFGFLAPTSAGWVLVVVGLAVAGVAGGVSIGVDKYLKNRAGDWYDDIMKWMGTL